MNESAPWYRQGWPWFLILLPLTVVIACFVTLYLALSTDEALVRDDYYKEGLAINQRLEAEANARARGIEAQLRYDAATLAIELQIAAAPAPELTLTIVHPTDDERDQAVVLQAAGNGLYRGKVGAALDGKRYILLEHEDGPQGAWRLRGTFVPGSESVTSLRLDAD
ncbi:MAG TPA: FixH family protein [Pseudomonadales bacterium]|mgnify:FL=1|nr:FixH family protein [Pseudomonadales bacterium]